MTTLSLEDKKWYKMQHCVQVGCLGHLGKFDSCVCEALYELSLDGAFKQTGDVQFDGLFTLIELQADESVQLLDGSEGPVITLPSGTYLMREDTLGHVAAYFYDEPLQGCTEFELAESYFDCWTDGEEGI